MTTTSFEAYGNTVLSVIPVPQHSTVPVMDLARLEARAQNFKNHDIRFDQCFGLLKTSLIWWVSLA